MKALWKGNISFALVNIPVNLYSATHSRSLDLHILHKKCSTPLHYERYCSTCGTGIPWEDTVRGYEYEKGKFVVITNEEMENITVKTSKGIDILRFIGAEEIPPIHYDKSYYLEPDNGGEHAYALLRETMKSSNKVGFAKITFKEKEHIAIIRVYQDILILHTLFYVEEIVKAETLNIPGKVSLDPKEIALAHELVRHFTGRFNIETFHDEYRKEMMKLIKAKIAGKEIRIAPKKEVERVVTLMEALKKSLERKKKAG